MRSDPTISNIPADIKETAMAYAKEWYCGQDGDLSFKSIVYLITLGLVSERERNFKIANEWKSSISTGVYSHEEVDEICNTIGPNIATAILGRPV